MEAPPRHDDASRQTDSIGESIRFNSTPFRAGYPQRRPPRVLPSWILSTCGSSSTCRRGESIDDWPWPAFFAMIPRRPPSVLGAWTNGRRRHGRLGRDTANACGDCCADGGRSPPRSVKSIRLNSIRPRRARADGRRRPEQPSGGDAMRRAAPKRLVTKQWPRNGTLATSH